MMSQNLRNGLWRRQLCLWARIPVGFCRRVKPDTGEHTNCWTEGTNHKDGTLKLKNVQNGKISNVKNK